MQLNHLVSWGKWLSVWLRTKWLRVWLLFQSLKLQIWLLFWARSSWQSGKYRVWNHSEMPTLLDTNIQSNGPYRKVLTIKLNRVISLAKLLSVRLGISSCWFGSLCSNLTGIAPVSTKEFLDINGNIECGFTVKCVCDMIITYSRMEGKDKYSKHSAIIWSVLSNRWVFGYELSDCGFDSRCSHLNVRYGPCFEQGVIDIHSNIEPGFTLKYVRGIIIKCNQIYRTDNLLQQSSIIWSV